MNEGFHRQDRLFRSMQMARPERTLFAPKKVKSNIVKLAYQLGEDGRILVGASHDAGHKRRLSA